MKLWGLQASEASPASIRFRFRFPFRFRFRFRFRFPFDFDFDFVRLILSYALGFVRVIFPRASSVGFSFSGNSRPAEIVGRAGRGPTRQSLRFALGASHGIALPSAFANSCHPSAVPLNRISKKASRNGRARAAPDDRRTDWCAAEISDFAARGRRGRVYQCLWGRTWRPHNFMFSRDWDL